MRLRAGILPFALVVSFLVASFCASVLLLAYYHKFIVQKSILQQKLKRNCLSAMELSLAFPADTFHTWTAIDLFGKSEDTVWIKNEQWGMLRLSHVKAVRNHRQELLSAFIGQKVSDKLPALYVADHQAPVKLVGQATIRGEAFLPKAGVKPGLISGIGYKSNELVLGETYVSSTKLPSLQRKFIGSTILNERHSYNYITDLPESLSVSFDVDSSFVYEKDTDLTIRSALSGRIIVRSQKSITVSKSAMLDGILLLAPKIYIESGFRGRLQAIASDTLIVSENVHLEYPSVLSLQPNSAGGVMQLEGNSKVMGEVNLLNKIADSRSVIKIGRKAVVIGLVYSERYLELKGTVIGSIYTDKFILSTPSKDHENIIYDGVIDQLQLPRYFVFSSLPVMEHAAIIQWISKK